MSKIKLEVPENPPESLQELLKTLFWHEPEVVEAASKFLQYIKEWSRTDTPYRVDQWTNYCTRAGITQSRYHNMLKRLKGAGLVDKVYNKSNRVHELHLSEQFTDKLDAMTEAWSKFKLN